MRDMKYKREKKHEGAKVQRTRMILNMSKSKMLDFITKIR